MGRLNMKVVHVKVPESMSERDVKVAAAIEALSKGTVSIGKAAAFDCQQFDDVFNIAISGLWIKEHHKIKD